ncbi:hypothetical protein HH308_06385 [Gordonia sp. TBRC 11910]|uniref:LGFP repeat-containing protein n=1 Tax=Gordonia asplenii TaxID=2725283 RepID=A0A848KR35_9ACTN|nr:hypothetical protein [Gordonia asplenii]NMO00840.1 hypothetical protein [Gordonia asplenii]
MTMTVSIERAQEVHDRARARNGLPYAYGGAFRRDPKVSCDCSALVLQSGAWYGGRTDWDGNRYGSTESFRLDYDIVYRLGFKRFPRGGLSAIPIKPVMLVGLMHGGGGEYSHTACTLMTMDRPGGPVVQSARGVDWESMGDGVRLYDLARSWSDPLFHDFWYLDAVLQPAVVVNEIDQELKRAAAWIGRRLDAAEVTLPDGQGRMVRCEGGVVYWHPHVNTGAPQGMRAIAVPTAVMEVWKRVGYEKGPLGYPTVRHYTDAAGAIQAFQGGAIYRKNGTAGGILTGRILQRYASEKYEHGPLGWPLGDEQFYDGGRQQAFEHGTAIWHPSQVVELLTGGK